MDPAIGAGLIAAIGTLCAGLIGQAIGRREGRASAQLITNVRRIWVVAGIDGVRTQLTVEWGSGSITRRTLDPGEALSITTNKGTQTCAEAAEWNDEPEWFEDETP